MLQAVQFETARTDLRALGGSVQIAGYSRSATGFNGDYQDVMAFGDGSIGVMIGDVTGHDESAWLLKRSVEAHLHRNLVRDTSPRDVLLALRDLFPSQAHGFRLMSFCYVVIDPLRHRLTYGNAGHVSPLHYRHGAGTVGYLAALDPLLGAGEFPAFRQRRCAWNRDDVLVLYTDGITERRNRNGEMFGPLRLETAVRGALRGDAEAIKDAILDAVDAYAAETARDDQSITVLKFR